jgi:alpha-tubulin suppressor-like RCC1 family protein
VNDFGQLGQGDVVTRGDNPGELGDFLPPIDLGTGAKVLALSPGSNFQCAMLYTGIKCWGRNTYGILGLGDTNHRGDDPGEMGDALPFVDVGDTSYPVELVSSAGSSCVRLEDGSVKCWGNGFAGQLGQGNTENLGDNPGEMGNALPSIDLGTGLFAQSIVAGNSHVCALFAGGKLKCWGHNDYGELGLGDTNNRGDQPGEMGDNLPFVDLGTGARVVAVSASGYQTCALLDSGKAKCWGLNSYGQLGLGDTENRGDQPGEMGDALPSVDVGLP